MIVPFNTDYPDMLLDLALAVREIDPEQGEIANLASCIIFALGASIFAQQEVPGLQSFSEQFTARLRIAVKDFYPQVVDAYFLKANSCSQEENEISAGAKIIQFPTKKRKTQYP